MTNKLPISQCCSSPITAKFSDEGTSYYICEACNKPCDPIFKKKFGKKEQKKILKIAAKLRKYDREKKEKIDAYFLSDVISDLEYLGGETLNQKYGFVLLHEYLEHIFNQHLKQAYDQGVKDASKSSPGRLMYLRGHRDGKKELAKEIKEWTKGKTVTKDKLRELCNQIMEKNK